MKSRPSIKTDLETYEKIEQFLELPNLNFKSRADFVNKAIKEKIEKIEKELNIQEDHRLFNKKIDELVERVEKQEKELKYFKKEYKQEERYRKDPGAYRRDKKRLDKQFIKVGGTLKEIEQIDNLYDEFNKNLVKLKKQQWLDKGWTEKDYEEIEQEKQLALKKYREREKSKASQKKKTHTHR